jgi:hypothetical protein
VHRGVGRVSKIGRHAVSDDLKEPPVAARFVDLLQCTRIVVETADVDHGNVRQICHDSLS